MRTIPSVFFVMVVFFGSAHAQNLLINEIFTGDPDLVEITNFGTAPVDLSNFTFHASFGLLVYPTYTIPNGTILPPESSLVLIEGNAGWPLSSPPAPGSAIILNTGINYGWIGTSSGSVALVDLSGSVIDFVVFGTGAVAWPTPAIGENFTNPIDRSQNNASLHDVLFRTSSVDTNDGQDWSISYDGQETPGSFNPGQVLGPVDIKSVVFDPAFPSVLTLDYATQTFAVTTLVKSLVTASGAHITDANVDGLIGGLVTFSGTFGGGNTTSLDGMVFSPATLVLHSADGSDQLVVLSVWQNTNTREFTLGGGLGAAPIETREVRNFGTAIVTRSGAGSPSLTSLQGSLSGTTFSMLLEVKGGVISAVQLQRDYVPAPVEFRAALAGDTFGTLELGVIGANNAAIYNFFAVNPSTPLGTGPLGIEIQPLAWQIAAAPLGAAPFHVAADPAGNYYFSTAAGTVPNGWVVHHAALKLDANGVAISAPSSFTY